MIRMAKANDLSDDSLSVRIGAFIRLRRTQLGLTQKELARILGITAQQVQKYESGANALRLPRLMQFSAALQCPLENFLLIFNTARHANALNEDAPNFAAEPSGLDLPLEDVEAFLVQFFSLSREIQLSIIKLVRALAATDD